MSDKEPLKITLDDLEAEQAEPEAPAAPPEETSRLRAQAEEAGRQVAGSVKETAGKLSQKIAAGAADVTSRSTEAAREKMGEVIQAQSKATADAIEARLRQVDWKQEAQKGAEGGLRWLSKRIDELAGKLAEAPAKEGDDATPEDKPAGEK